MGDEVVAAALEEFGGEVGGPVGAVDFERVGEDGVRGLVAEGVEEGCGDVGYVGVDCGAGEVVEDEAFGAVGGAFDGLVGVAGDEEDGGGLGYGVRGVGCGV